MSPLKKILSQNGDPMLSARKAAKRLKCAPDYVGKLCREGKIRGVRTKTGWLVDQQSLVQFEKERAAARLVRSQELSELRRQENQLHQGYSVPQQVSAPVTSLAPSADTYVRTAKKILSPATSSLGLIPTAGMVVGGIMLATAVVGASALGPHTPLAHQSSSSQSAALGEVQSPFFGTHPPTSVSGNSGAGTTPSIGSIFSDLLAYIFGPKTPTVVVNPAPVPTPTPQSAPQPTPQSTPTPVPTPAPKVVETPKPTTIIQQTYPVIERTVERVVSSGGLTVADVDAKISALNAALQSQISSLANPGYGTPLGNFSPPQRIDILNNVQINGATGLTDNDIPNDITVDNYLRLSGGTLTGALLSSSTATSTFENGFNILSGCFSVNGVCITSGGGGGGGSGTVDSGTGGYVAYYAADGTTVSATSSLYIASRGNIGIGTTSPFAKLSINAGPTDPLINTTLFAIGSSTASATTTLFSVDNTGLASFVKLNGTSATSTNLATTNFFVGSLTGPLQAINGAVSATSTLATVYGGTGLSTLPSYGEVLVGNSSGGYTLTATSSLGFFNTANIFSALQQFSSNASTTQFSVYNGAYFGATATSTFTSTGALGLGTSTPSKLLSVQGNALISGDLNVANVTATGTLTLATSLSGILKATSGVVSVASAGTDYLTGSGTNGNCVRWGASNTLADAGSPCGSGSGSGGGSFATTTSTVSGQLINYSLNTTDIVTVGGSATTTAAYWFDPNALTAFLGNGRVGIGTTSPAAKFSIQANSTDSNVFRTLFQIASSTASGTTTLFAVSNNPVSANQALILDASGVLTSTSTLSVNNGGTGASSFTANGIVFGNGTGALQTTAAAPNSILITNSSNVPSFSTTLPAFTLGGAVTGNNQTLTGLGQVSVGTTSPYALLSIHASSTAQFAGNTLFAVASSTASATTTIFAIGNTAIGQNQPLYLNNAGYLSATSSLSVNNGGTGASSFTLNGVVFGNGSGALQATAAAANSILVTNGSNVPSFSTTLPAYTLGGTVTGAGQAINNIGQLGISTTSPFAKLSVNANSTDSVFATLFAIASSTATATTTLFAVDNTGLASFVKLNGTSATSTNLATTNFHIGSLTGPLQAINGAVSATSTLSVFYGGTGLSTIPSYGQVLVGTATGGYTLMATSSLGISAGGSGGVGTGTTGQVPYYAADGTNLSATSSLFIASNGNIGVGGTTTPMSRVSISGGNITQVAAGTTTLATTTTTANHAYATYVVGNYAYSADYEGGLKIVDISNPKIPVFVGRYSGISSANKVIVAGKYAYVTDNATGLNIIDVSNPASPTLVGRYPMASGSAVDLAVSGNKVFVTDYNGGAVRVVDVGNPAAPTTTATYATGGNPNSVAVSGKYLYIGDFAPAFYIVDISTTTPSLVGTYNTSANIDSPSGIQISGRYAYVADRVKGLLILDVSNPASPTRITNYSSGSSYYGVQIAGDYAYVADHDDGSFVQLDVSYPATPTVVGRHKFGACAVDNFCPMHVTVSGKYAYVADYANGLSIMDLNGIAAPAANIGSIQSGTINVTENANIGGELFAGGGLNVGNSGISSRGAITASRIGIGTSTSFFSKFSIQANTTDSIISPYLFTIGSSTPTATSTLFAVTNAGRVGIGSTTPNQALDVAGDITIGNNNSYRIGNVAILYATSTQQSVFVGQNATPGYNASASNNTFVGYNSGLNVTSGANNVVLGSWSVGSNNNLTSGSNNVLIGYNVSLPSATGNNQLNVGNLIYGTSMDGSGQTYSTGRVGIGSTTPIARFSIQANNGDANTMLFAIGSSTASATTTLFSVNNIGNVAAAGTLSAGTTTITNLVVTNTSTSTFAGPISAATGDLIISAAGTTNRLLFNPYGGSVGIGTTSPSATLALQQTISAPQLRIGYDQSRYADFQVNSAGDLVVNSQSGNVSLLQNNFFVCTGGACPTLTLGSRGGNLVVGGNLYFASSTVMYLGNGFQVGATAGTSTAISITDLTGSEILRLDQY